MVMPAPRTGSPFSNTVNATDTSISATGSIQVQEGDLIFVLYRMSVTAPATTFSDNLTSTYNAVTPPATSGNSTRAAWARVSSAGTLTTVTASYSSTNARKVIAVAVFSGPFETSPLDKTPAQTTDASSPYTGPASGTLSQAYELILQGMSCNPGVASMSAGSPASMCGSASTGTGASEIAVYLGYRVVNSTTSVTPSFSGGTSLTSAAQYTWTFKLKPIPRRTISHSVTL